jgi:predicted 3-demethylubiquinone-9 3-methyltransferase (glyoxalase superfamily)
MLWGSKNTGFIPWFSPPAPIQYQKPTPDKSSIEQCGWLKDKYGVSWQIVPAVLGELMSDPDPEKTNRVMKALLQMKKIDINGLKQTYDRE